MKRDLARRGWLIPGFGQQSWVAHSIVSRRGAEPDWSEISDVECNPPRRESHHDHESAVRRAGRSMIVVDLRVIATRIHHDHGGQPMASPSLWRPAPACARADQEVRLHPKVPPGFEVDELLVLIAPVSVDEV